MLATKTSKIQFRVEPKIKEKAMKVLLKQNLDLSFVLQNVVREIAITRKSPVQVKTVNGMTPEAEARILLNSKNAKRSKSFDNVTDFMKALKSEYV